MGEADGAETGLRRLRDLDEDDPVDSITESGGYRILCDLVKDILVQIIVELTKSGFRILYGLLRDALFQVNDISDDIPNVTRNGKRQQTNTSQRNPKRIRPNGKVAIANEQDVEPTPESSSSLRDCPICYESLENRNISATMCGHVYCTECIAKAIDTSKTCPTCRTTLTPEKIHPLYL